MNHFENDFNIILCLLDIILNFINSIEGIDETIYLLI